MASPWSDLSRPPLRTPALRAALLAGPGGDHGWRALDVVESTGSTNADLAARARAGEAAGAVLVAEHQSAGRGRMSRTWTAPPRASLAVSVLLRPRAPAQRWSWLPLLAGVAVVDALTTTCGLPARLKWPNDVLLPDAGDPRATQWRKVAGILAEVVTGGAGPAAVVLGLGLNVSQTVEELGLPSATSLLAAGAAVLDRDTVLRAYLRALDARFRRWDAAGGDVRAGGVAATYREVCATLGRDVEIRLERRTPLLGRAVEVDDAGRLVVEAAGERHLLAAGDVVHVRPGPDA